MRSSTIGAALQALQRLPSHARMTILTILIVAAWFGLLGFGVDWIVLLFPLFGTAVFLILRTLVQLSGSVRSVASNLASIIVALAGIWAMVVYGDWLQDPLRFLVWSLPRYGQIEALARRAGVIQHWDGWGIAGMENDSYLVSDPDDSITDLPAANRWARDHHLTCDIVAAQRMWRGFYILTTYNCAFRRMAHDRRM